MRSFPFAAPSLARGQPHPHGADSPILPSNSPRGRARTLPSVSWADAQDCRGTLRAGRLTCMRHSVVTAGAYDGAGRHVLQVLDGGSGRGSLAAFRLFGSRRDRPASGADPPRAAGVSSRRQPNVARQRRLAVIFRPWWDRSQPATRPRAPSGAISSPTSASIPPSPNPALQGGQQARQPDQLRFALTRRALPWPGHAPHGLPSAHHVPDSTCHQRPGDLPATRLERCERGM